MHNYILNITLAKGSGEYCISHLLAPGAHAHMPLVDRVEKLKIPVTFVCASNCRLSVCDLGSSFPPSDGDHDWMDSEGGKEAVENLRKAGNGRGRMYIIPLAGHHRKSLPLYLCE